MSTAYRTQRAKGAMTMAMEAVASNRGPKVLRVGLIQASRIVEERVIPDRATVTVGTSEKSTFTLADAELPSQFELFASRGGAYRLRFTDTMNGRIALPDGVRTLAELRSSGRATRVQDSWEVAINDDARGKITVGNFSVLFQFVAAPPARPRPQLPLAIRSNPIKNIDWAYNACLASFLAMAFGAVSYVEYGYDPIVEDGFDLSARIVSSLLPPPVIEPAPPSDPVVASGEPVAPRHDPATTTAPRPSDHTRPVPHAPVATRDPAPRTDPSTDARAIAAAEHTAATALSAFEHNAEWHPITGFDASHAGSAIDHLAAGALIDSTARDLATAVGVGRNPATGIDLAAVVASNGPAFPRHGRPVAPTGPEVTSGTPGTIVAHVPVGRITVERPDEPIGGDVDAGAVAAVVRRELGGIRWCYNEGIRQNPTLQGRLEIHFTIGTSGRVAGTPSVSGLSEAPAVRQCIANRFQRFVFPQPTGAVEFTFPFQFTPGT